MDASTPPNRSLRRVAVGAVLVLFAVACAPDQPGTPAPGPIASNPNCAANLIPDETESGVPGAEAAQTAVSNQIVPTDADQIEVGAEVNGELKFVRVQEADASKVVGFLDHIGEVVAVGPAQRVSALAGAAELDGEVGASAESPDPRRNDQWALDNVDFESVWNSTRGAGTVIAIVDTGIVGNHADLYGRVSGGVSTLGGGEVAGGGNTDPHGHGTHVAGISAAGSGDDVGIAGVAPDATLMPVKVLDASGSGWSSDVAAGIVWATENGADVINMSLSSSSLSTSVRVAVDAAIDKGVVVVAAAGNAGPSSAPQYPAAYTPVIAVAATTSADTVAGFSSNGSYVDVAAPGQSVLSVWKGGYAELSGTSMAAPHVAGLAALLEAKYGALTQSQVEGALTCSADDLGTPGKDNQSGHGLIDATGAAGGV